MSFITACIGRKRSPRSKTVTSIILWMLIVNVSGTSSVVLAQGLVGPSPASVPRCKQHIVDELIRVRDTERSYIFGSMEQSDGTVIAKTGGAVDAVRAGILETRGRMTTELVPPIVQSYRSFRCHALAVCQAMEASLPLSRTAPITPLVIQNLGCLDETISSYPECQLGPDERGYGGMDQQDKVSLMPFCTQLVDMTLEVERAELKAAVSYDAGYRSLLQFSGMFESMLRHIPNFSFIPLRTMAGMLGKLYQIPCFIGQCDMRPTKTTP